MATAILKSNIMGIVEKGQVVLFAEYRSSKAEILNWRDKTTGRSMSGPSLRHTVETPSESICVLERVTDEGFKPEEYVSPFKKGTPVLVSIDSFERNKGLATARGTIHTVTDSAK